MATNLNLCANPKCGRFFVKPRAAKKYCDHKCWRTANRESINETNRKTYRRGMSTAVGREKRRQYSQRYRENNPDKLMRAAVKRAAKMRAANEILKWAKEQGVYNG